MPTSFGLILKILGLLFFSGVMFTVLVSKSKLSSLQCQISPGLACVSLISCTNVPTLMLSAAISWSISVSLGTKGSFGIAVYVGGVHVPPTIAR